MTAFFTILTLIFFGALVVVASMHPRRSNLSHAELRRQSGRSEVHKLELERYELHPAIITTLRSAQAFFLVLVAVFALVAFGGFLGTTLALVGAIFYPSLARIGFVNRAGQSFYQKIEPELLDFVVRFKRIVNILREPAFGGPVAPLKVHSRDELADLINNSKEVVGVNERKLLASALAFPDKTVSEIMTPRGVIDFIKSSEFLGPLVLDELHALGHSRLPVIAEDLNHVVGVLNLRDLLSLDVKNSTTAEKAMEAKVFYIREDDTLEHALAAFIRTRHHLFIVIDKNRETVGLLTLEDVMEQLIGRTIVDEDDIHADLRAVAEQEGKTNNASLGHVDI